MRGFTSLALAGAFVTLVAGGAQAADMGFPPMPGLPPISGQPVELGTGWYLRGDVGGSRDEGPLIAPLGYPLAAGANPVNVFLGSEVTNGYSLDVGFGYKFNNWLRADIVYDYRKPESATATSTVWCPYNLVGLSTQGSNSIQLGYYYNPSDTCTQQQSAKLSRQDLLLNGYLDLGTWGGVTPYVGAGVGFVRTEVSGTVNYKETANGEPYKADLTPIGTYPPQWVDINGNPLSPQPGIAFTKQNWNRSIKSVSYHLAWALMGGFAVAITDHLQADIGYRYVDLGTLTGFDVNTGRKITKHQSTQEVRLGFRYMID